MSGGKSVVGVDDFKKFIKSNDLGLTTQEAQILGDTFTVKDKAGQNVIDLDQIKDSIKESQQAQIFDVNGNPIEVFDTEGNKI